MSDERRPPHLRLIDSGRPDRAPKMPEEPPAVDAAEKAAALEDIAAQLRAGKLHEVVICARHRKDPGHREMVSEEAINFTTVGILEGLKTQVLDQLLDPADILPIEDD